MAKPFLKVPIGPVWNMTMFQATGEPVDSGVWAVIWNDADVPNGS